MLCLSPALDGAAMRKAVRRAGAGPAPRSVLPGVAALLFAGGAAATIAACASMAALDAPMPGGWMLSAMWTPTCAGTWRGAAAAFAGLWCAMTLAMMLPPLLPALWRYRRALDGAGAWRADALAALAGLACFATWTAGGIAVFAPGALLADALMRTPALARAVPLASGLVVLAAGAVQLSAWKAQRLACCRAPSPCRRAEPATARAAWRHGLRLGAGCIACCANLTAVLLALGMMQPGAMAAVTAAIAAERLAPQGYAAARFVGVAMIGIGAFLAARALAAA